MVGDAKGGSMGVPVDLRSVEVALLASGRVRDAAVIERSTDEEQASDQTSPPVSSRPRLIAYVVADEWLRVRELRAYLAGRVPDHLIPSAFVLLDQLPPATATGRHWSGSPVPSHTRPDLDTPYAAPRNDVEHVLSELWARALDLDQVGIHDDFIDLGGDSRIAMTLMAAFEERFGQDAALASLFEQPTIASFARTVFGGDNGDLGGRIG